MEDWERWEHFDKHLSEDHQIWLDRPFIASEVHKTAFQIRATKPPGPNGFSRCFFQKYWDIVGASVTIDVLSFLNSSRMLRQINYTHVALIPKILLLPLQVTSDLLAFGM